MPKTRCATQNEPFNFVCAVSVTDRSFIDFAKADLAAVVDPKSRFADLLAAIAHLIASRVRAIAKYNTRVRKLSEQRK